MASTTKAVAALAGLALSLVAQPARADAKQQALEEMTRAQDALDRGDFDGAIERFQKAHDLQPDSSGPYLGLGLANAGAGRCEAAVPALEQYLQRKKQNPKPEATNALEECKRRLSKPPPGRVLVISEPSGAEVRIDDAEGAPLGLTPYEATLTDGPHRVLVSKNGYQTGVREISTTAGATERLWIALTRLSAPRPAPPVEVRPSPPPPPPPPAAQLPVNGTIVVDVAPGAALSVNGIRVAENTSHYEGAFQRGVYSVLVERDGFRSATFTAPLEPGGTAKRNVKLKPLRSYAWLGLAIPMTLIAAGAGIGAIVTFYAADGAPPGPDFDTNSTANAALQGVFYPSLALAATGYLLYGLLNRGKLTDGPPLEVSFAPNREGGGVGTVKVRF